LDHLLESQLISFRERAKLGRIDVEYRYELARTSKYRHDYLRAGSRITGNMIRELADVLNDDRLALSGGFTADPFAELNLEAAEAPLVRADTKELVCFDHSVEACPQETQRTMQESGDRRHPGNLIVDAFEDQSQLRCQLCIRGAPWKLAQI
jgi:hypothetical protein